MNIQTTAIIRDRGQLTLPDKIRTLAQWAQPSSVVNISSSENEIIIRPFEGIKKVDWDEIWRGLRKVRSFKGKKGSASRFIIKDRERH